MPLGIYVNWNMSVGIYLRELEYLTCIIVSVGIYHLGCVTWNESLLSNNRDRATKPNSSRLFKVNRYKDLVEMNKQFFF